MTAFEKKIASQFNLLLRLEADWKQNDKFVFQFEKFGRRLSGL